MQNSVTEHITTNRILDPFHFLEVTLCYERVVQKRVVFLDVISNFVSRLLECQNWNIISKLEHNFKTVTSKELVSKSLFVF